MGQELVRDVVPAATQRVDGLGEIAAVPEHDRGEEQVQPAGAVELVLVGAITDLA